MGKTLPNKQPSKTSYWFQPTWKIFVKLDHFWSKGRNKKQLKPPPRKRLVSTRGNTLQGTNTAVDNGSLRCMNPVEHASIPASHVSLPDYMFFDVILITFPETNSSHLKIGHPKRKRSYYNHPFSGANLLFVSAKIRPQTPRYLENLLGGSVGFTHSSGKNFCHRRRPKKCQGGSTPPMAV